MRRAGLITARDRRAIACNFREGTSVARKGALAYVTLANPGGGSDRVSLLVRSRGGRWVTKWEAMHRLRNFRLKTIPPGHYLYDRSQFWQADETTLERLRKACEREDRT